MNARDTCSHCGAAISKTAAFCHQCGKPVGTDSDTDQLAVKTLPRLWNPNAAAAWSILFTPIFGSFMHMRNWKVLADSRRAAQASAWVWISVFGVLGAYFFLSPDGPAQVAVLSLLVVWYLTSGRRQAAFIKGEQDGTYEHKGWVVPLCGGVGIVLVLSGIITVKEESAALAAPQILGERQCVGDYGFVNFEPDYGVRYVFSISNEGLAGPVMIEATVSTSEGEWRRQQTLLFDAGETQTLDYFFPEPTLNASNIQCRVIVSP